MTAEVGLLTRNIKIIGEDYPQLQNEAFGARVLVGSYTEAGTTFTGKLNHAYNIPFSRLYYNSLNSQIRQDQPLQVQNIVHVILHAK